MNFQNLVNGTLKIGLFLTIVSTLSNCQTTTSRKLPIRSDLPAQVNNMFGSCKQGDGAGSASYFDAKQLLLRFHIEWITDDSNGWQIQVSDEFGRPLLNLTWDANKRKIIKKGSLPGSSINLDVDELGLIKFNHFTSSFKAAHVPCFLKGLFPRSWLKKGFDFERTKETFRVYSKQGGTSSLIELTRGPKGQACASLTRTGLLNMFNPSLSWCIEPNGVSVMHLPGNKRVRWDSSDD